MEPCASTTTPTESIISAAGIVDKVDVVVLAQGSMAYAEPHLEGVYGKPFLGSPVFGAAELKKALQKKGVI